MFFLDAEPETILKRIRGRDELEIFETHDNLVKVRRKALKLVEDWYIVDTSGSIEDTFSVIEKKLVKLDSIC